MSFEPAFPDETEDLLAGVPPRLLESLRAYGLHHRPTGDFLRAVLANNLVESVARSDRESYDALAAIVLYIWNAMPAACHGSPEAVVKWIRESQ